MDLAKLTADFAVVGVLGTGIATHFHVVGVERFGIFSRVR